MPRLLLTIWLVFLGFFAEGLPCPSQAAGHLEFAVDARTCISTIGYDGESKAGFGYDRTAVLITTTESAKQSVGARTFFVNFAEFLAAEETPAVFENAPSGFSNGNLAQAAHNNFESALNDLYGTQEGDWEMRTAPGQTGVDATYVGPASRNPGFNFGELKPYSENSLGTFGNQLGNWGSPEGQTELFFYNKGGVIGSSGFRF